MLVFRDPVFVDICRYHLFHMFEHVCEHEHVCEDDRVCEHICEHQCGAPPQAAARAALTYFVTRNASLRRVGEDGVE